MPSRNLNIVSPDQSADAMAESLQEEGYIIIERLAVETAEQALQELSPHINQAPRGYDEFLGKRTRRVGGILEKSPAARDLVMHPAVLALCDRCLLPHAARYQLNFSGIMHLEPRAKAQPPHRDGTLYPISIPSMHTLAPAMWALTEFDADNGATLVAPGSHLWPYEREPEPDELVSAVMPQGSVLVYLSGTWHGGGENCSNRVRTGLSLQYSLAWLRQEENQYLANPPEVARHYPEALRRLIGYDYGGPYLGFYKGDDPHRIFESDYDGPALRSNTELEAAKERIKPIR